MSRIRLMAMMVVVAILMCLAASAALATEYIFLPENEKVTIDYIGDPYFGDGRCRWYVDLWNSGLQQRMYQGQKQVFVKRATLGGSGYVNGEWNSGNPPRPHFGSAFPSAYISNLNESLGRLDTWSPRWRDYNGGNGQWISSTLVGEAKIDHSQYPGFELTGSSNIEIDFMEVLD